MYKFKNESVNGLQKQKRWLLLIALIWWGFISQAVFAAAPQFEIPSSVQDNEKTVMKMLETSGLSGAGAYNTMIDLNSTGSPYVVYRDEQESNKTTVMYYDGSNWKVAGSSGFSAGAAEYPSIAMHGNTPYVVYSDASVYGKATVKTFNGSTWVTVGTVGFTPYKAEDLSIDINSTGAPYISFRNADNIWNKATVMKYDGSNWVLVGSGGFSDTGCHDTHIALDSNDIPYVAYQDGSTNSKIAVKKFDGSNWVLVGTKGFSDHYAFNIDLAIDSSDVPYVVFKDAGNDNKATVMTYDGSTWVNIGSAGFSAGAVGYTSLAIDGADQLYVAYRDAANGSKTTVMTYDGSSWIVVDSVGISTGAANYTSVAADSTGSLYVVYSDTSYGEKMAAQKYDGSGWEGLEMSGFSPGSANYTSIAVDDNGTPYVAFEDLANDYKATVMKFDNNNWTNVGSPGFSEKGVSYTSIAIDSNGEPYVAYKTRYSTYDPWTGETRTYWYPQVSNFNGTDWLTKLNRYSFDEEDYGHARYASMVLDNDDNYYIVYKDDYYGYGYASAVSDGSFVGRRGFSLKSIDYPSIAVDSNNTPYVAYRDSAQPQKVTVKKYDGSNWVNVGIAGFSAGGASYTSIAIDHEDVPYVLFRDDNNSYKTTVMKYSGSSWINVGMAGFSAGGASYTSIAIDHDNVPYIIFRDNANSNKATLMKYDGSSWVNVGTPGFSVGGARYTSISIDKRGIPYTVFAEDENSGRATVAKAIFSYRFDVFENNASVGDINATDPDNDIITYSIDGTDSSFFSIISTTGELSFNAAPDFETPQDSNSDNIYEFNVTVTADSETVTKPVRVFVVDRGTIISDGGGDTAAVSIDENTLVATTVLTNAPVSFSLSGPDAGSFNINQQTGELSFNIAPDFESQSSYVVTVVANENGASDSQTITVTVNDVSEGPIFDIPIENRKQIWEVVGVEGFDDAAWYYAIAIDGSGKPYVTYSNYRARASSFDGSNWVTVGSSDFSAGATTYTDIALNGSGTPYVVYRDAENSNKATVMKFDGSSWVNVSIPGFSIGEVEYTTIAIDDYGTVYVAYQDQHYSKKVTVMKYDGSSWTAVGPIGFSAGEARHPVLALDKAGVPYVAYSDAENGNKATVKKFDTLSNSWQTVGDGGLSGSSAGYVTIAIDGNNVPYVAYQDGGASSKATVMKFESDNWVTVGLAGFSENVINEVALAIDGHNVPYVAYKGFSNKGTVKKFNASSWTTVDSVDYFDGQYYDLAIDNNNNPYVVNNSNKITVWQAGEHYNFKVIENTTAIASLDAHDPESDPITYMIDGGVDSALFQIDSTSGLLSFINAPDYDNPQDAGTDNLYELSVAITANGDTVSTIVHVIVMKEDSDGDGVADDEDNCPSHSNPSQEDMDGDGIGDACDSNYNDGPLGDLDGDGINNEDDMYDNDGPDGDWDGDGIPNHSDPDDSDGPGLTDEQRYYEQGTRNTIMGNITQDTQPYPEDICDHSNPCIQGTQTPDLDPGDPSDDPEPYDPRPECDDGWVQGTNECVNR